MQVSEFVKRYRHKRKNNLYERFPPSEPCSCEICLAYCQRPGWWTVAEARQAIEKGYANRMMLEVAPEGGWAVISPAFYGCEGYIAVQEAARNGCNFLKNNLCELYGSGVQPLECRFCHHDRVGQGKECHAALEADWYTEAGQALVKSWKRLQHIQIDY
jgi:Fe-S-cluster containining protein